MNTPARKRATPRYILYGALFGLLFPMLALAADFVMQGAELSVASIIRLHRANPLHYAIDVVPVLLAVFAWFAGRREDRSRHLTAELQQQILERQQTVENLEKLQSTFAQEASGDRRARHKTREPDKDLLFVEKHKSVLEKLASTEIDNLTPIEAINLLNQIKKQM